MRTADFQLRSGEPVFDARRGCAQVKEAVTAFHVRAADENRRRRSTVVLARYGSPCLGHSRKRQAVGQLLERRVERGEERPATAIQACQSGALIKVAVLAFGKRRNSGGPPDSRNVRGAAHATVLREFLGFERVN